MHLHRKRPRLRLTFALTARALPQARQVLLADRHIPVHVARADVVDQHLQVHLGLAAQSLDVGQEVTLVGADRTA